MNPSPLPPSVIRLPGFGLFATLVLFSAVPNGATRAYTWPWVFYTELLLLAPVLMLGWRMCRHPVQPRPGGASLLALALSLGISVVLSRRPPLSFEVALPLWSGLAWTWLVAGWIDSCADEPGRMKFFTRAAGLAFILPLAMSLFLWGQDLAREASGPGGWPEVLAHLPRYRNPHPLGHWNYTGAFALLALPWLGVLAWTERGRWRALWVPGSALGLVVFFSASSRGAVLGAVVTLGLAIGGALATHRSSRRRTLAAVGLGLIAATCLFVSNPRLRALVVHPAGMFQPNEGDVQRLGMLRGGWLLGGQRPWIGHGPGMTPFVYPEIRAQLVGGVETSFQLHNSLLQLWVDAGVVGLAAGLWITVTLLLAVRRWWRAPAGDQRLFGLASSCTLAGYAGLALTDYQFDVLAMAAALGLHAGVVLAAPRDTTTQVSRRMAGGLVLFAGLASLTILGPGWRARQLFWRAWENSPTTAPAALIDGLRAAADAAPWNPHYRNHLGFQLALTAEETDNAVQRSRAREELSRSLKLDPAQEPVQAALGWLWLYDDPRQAEGYFQAALGLLPDRDTLHLGLALARYSLGNRTGAEQALAMECLVNPPFLASPLWTQEPLAPLRTNVGKILPGLWNEALRHPATPEWRKAALTYARAFDRWWLGGREPDTDELAGAKIPARDFFTVLARTHGEFSPSESWPAPWQRLAAAALVPARAAEILRAPPTPPSETVVAGALARLRQPPADLATLLRLPAVDGLGVSRTPIERGHFKFMHRNLDGPGYADFAPRFSDEFTAQFVGPLFPPRGLLPGPVIIQLDRKSASPARPAP